MDPSSSKCQALLLRVKMPKSEKNEIRVDLEPNQIWIQSFDYNLRYYLPCEVQKDKCKSRWDETKKILEITLIKKSAEI